MNKFLKTAVCLLLTICLLGAALPVLAEETEEPRPVVTISSIQDFLEFSRSCVRDQYSQDLTVSLEADLDFSGTEFTAVPIFSGTFAGNRHTIKGITLTTEGSQQGLFRYLTETAVVKDLIVSGTILPEGSASDAGGIAGHNSGTIRNCRFQGTVAGTERIGGIAGVNQVTGIIEDCSVSGTVRGTHFAGGVVGENLGTLRRCRNLCSVNTRQEDNTIDSVSITPEFFMGKEAADTVTDLGGIAGTSSGVIRDCENHGSVGYPHMGYNLGGIAGSQKGYIAGCKNFAAVSGRKEIGGIAGQQEPVIEISYTEDTLQILRRQLDNTSALANRASANIRSNSQDLGGDIENLHAQTSAAIDAVKALLPQGGDWPDADTIVAAHNTLTNSIGAMQGAVGSINESAQAIVGSAAADIRAITSSVSEISHTLDTAAEHLGGSITDISDEDTPDNLTGKIENCRNTGKISGDLNAGGIVGASAWESDKDPEEDYSVNGERSLNFDSKLRAVILNCNNSGPVTVKKHSAGGIVGNLNLGLVKSCTNTGPVSGETADYLGGIAGASQGFIRSCNAKCELEGHSFAGGIAGSASQVSDCRSTVRISADGERIGSVLGLPADNRADGDQPISGNFYLPLADHLGAIDGIDYGGQADSLPKQEFLELEGLSSVFSTATMTFLYPDGSSEKISVPLGQVVPEEKIPAPPRKEGYLSKWGQLEDLDLNHMFFNVILEPEYVRTNPVAVSDLLTEEGKPVLLAEGDFGELEQFRLESSPELPPEHPEGQSWQMPDLGTDENTVLHLAVPEGMDPQDARILLRQQDGSWVQTAAEPDGSYLVFTAAPTDLSFAVYESHAREITRLLTAAAGVLLILVFTVCFLLIRKKKKKKAAKK